MCRKVGNRLGNWETLDVRRLRRKVGSSWTQEFPRLPPLIPYGYGVAPERMEVGNI